MTSTKLPVPRSLGKFVPHLSPNWLPDEAAGVARLGFIDTIATMIAGRSPIRAAVLFRRLSATQPLGASDLTAPA